MNKFERSRRQFLRTASMASMAGISASPFILGLNSMAGMAQSSGSGGYKALVCVFLQGGNDGHGTVIATDPSSFSAFTQARSGAPGLAYPLGSLLPITLKTPQTGRTFALNPALTGAQNLFNSGRLAIVANSGTLIAPASKTQVNNNTVPLPDSLYSHFDQTAAWQAIASNGGSAEHVGWGGSVADVIESMNMNSNSMFTCISTAGIALFLAGQNSFQLNVTSAGRIPIFGLVQSPFGLPDAQSAFFDPLCGRIKLVRQGIRRRRQSLHSGSGHACQRHASGRPRWSAKSSTVPRSHDQQAYRQPARHFLADSRQNHKPAAAASG